MARNSIVIGILFVTATAASFAQSSKGTKDNLYGEALKASILQMEKSWGHIDDSVSGEQIRTDYLHMIVEDDPQITVGLPTTFEGHTIKYLDVATLIRHFKSVRKPFALLRIRPMRNEGSQLTISIVVYWFSYEKDKVQYALSDWSDVQFAYDCNRKAFAIASLKLGGI